MATYDSAKTRCAAQAIAQLASGMHSAVEPGMRAVRERMDLLQGRTARAMEEALDRLCGKSRRCTAKWKRSRTRLPPMPVSWSNWMRS